MGQDPADEREQVEADAERADRKMSDSVEEMERRTEQLGEHVEQLLREHPEHDPSTDDEGDEGGTQAGK